MIPENRLSTTPVANQFIWPEKRRELPLVGYHTGGKNISDPSEGLEVKTWTVAYDISTGNVSVSAQGSPTTVLFNDTDIKEVDLAFDQNMRPLVAYVKGTQAKFYWYDPTVAGYVHTNLPTGAKNPRCSMDDTRYPFTPEADIIIAYMRADSLYVRYQSQRFLTEHLMKSNCGGTLVNVGMNRGWRFQFYIWNASDGALVSTSPYLADVVKDLCIRGGIPSDQINVSELYDTRVIGYKCNTDDGLNKRIDALREVFIFDKSEADKKIFFPRRGRDPVARIPYVDLVADDPSALKETRIQEHELPKSVTVNHLDPAGAFAQNKQTVSRRSNLIAATKEQKFESEVVLTADQAMTAAVIKLKVAWYEQQKFAFATTVKYANVVPGSTVEVEDKKGNWHLIRVLERNDSGVILEFEGCSDAGLDVYSSLGVGHSLPPPVSTTPGLIGETRLEILNIPCLRDQDDELGVYVAVCGESSGWYGSQLLLSVDGGVSYYDVMQIETPATIGDLLTDLGDEFAAPEYPGARSFEVLTNFPLESLTDDSLQNNGNRCIVGDELLQFQFAILLGMVDGKYHYRCSGLIRGGYATTVETWPTGTRFVMLDSSIAFIQAQQYMLGMELNIKAVSLGQTEDETAPLAYDYDEGVSQREFPVSDVQALRDGSDNVTVTFIGRGRLGVGTAPRNGKYFAGYRVKFSNGHTIDTTDMTATYNSAPVGVTVQVCALNTVTGEGPYSTAIAT